MECLPKSKVLDYHVDTMENIRKNYGLEKAGDMARAVDILEEWVKSQQHFRITNYSRDYLERVIIAAKGSIEKSKNRIDRLCTIKTVMPQYFGVYNVRKDFKEFDNVVAYAVLPKLTKDNCRIVFVRSITKKFETTVILNFTRLLVVLCEYMMLNDYSDGYIILVDYREVDMMALINKITITELYQCVTILIEGYGGRFKGLHFVTESKIINIMIGMLKQVISAKLGDRISSSENIDTFAKFVPKDILPSDYGGKEKTLDELHDDWLQALSSSEHLDCLKEMSQATVDESLRPIDKFNAEYMGMPGTFRSLTVD